MDEEIRLLERTARATNTAEDLNNLQTARQRLGYSYADAEYLHKFLDICEQWESGRFGMGRDEDYETGNRIDPKPGTALALLQTLNEEYKFLVCKNTIKYRLANAIADGGNGWVSSSIGC